MSQIQFPKPKYLVLICCILTGVLVLGAFQNCSSRAVKPEFIDTSVNVISPEGSFIEKQERAPASINDMIRSSENEIQKTKINMENSHMGFEGRTRQIANSPDTEKEDEMKIRLKAKRSKSSTK